LKLELTCATMIMLLSRQQDHRGPVVLKTP